MDAPGDGAWNMALDEALLLSAESEDVATLRFYTWSEPTLSLGYFQSHADRQSHAASLICPLVRRASGGGAILHDRELTYSIALPGSHPMARRAEMLYAAAHESLVMALCDLGVAASLCNGEQHSQTIQNEPFLCFQRRVSGDVLVGSHKIGGSAQRRHKGAVLQHGSVLLSRSQAAPELPGINELTGRLIQADELRDAWQPYFTKRVGLKFHLDRAGAGLLAIAKDLSVGKFSADHWTMRR